MTCLLCSNKLRIALKQSIYQISILVSLVYKTSQKWLMRHSRIKTYVLCNSYCMKCKDYKSNIGIKLELAAGGCKDYSCTIIYYTNLQLPASAITTWGCKRFISMRYGHEGAQRPCTECLLRVHVVLLYIPRWLYS